MSIQSTQVQLSLKSRNSLCIQALHLKSIKVMLTRAYFNSKNTRPSMLHRMELIGSLCGLRNISRQCSYFISFSFNTMGPYLELDPQLLSPAQSKKGAGVHLVEWGTAFNGEPGSFPGQDSQGSTVGPMWGGGSQNGGRQVRPQWQMNVGQSFPSELKSIKS